MDKKAIHRFWSKVNKNTASGCWLWTRQGKGGRKKRERSYGRFNYKGKQYKAHRISWLLHGLGPIGDLQVLHECDTPPCVNPYHLFLGTQKDNMQDMLKKGRRRL